MAQEIWQIKMIHQAVEHGTPFSKCTIHLSVPLWLSSLKAGSWGCLLHFIHKKHPNAYICFNKQSQSILSTHWGILLLSCDNSCFYGYSPMIEMTIPSSLDPTIAPPGHHVVLLFTQYTPYTLGDGQTWDDQTKNAYADTGKIILPI